MGRRLFTVVVWWAALVAALHLWGGLFPDANNWGLHLFAFLPGRSNLAFPLLMLLALYPPFQNSVLGYVHRLTAAWEARTRRRRMILLAAIAIIVACCFWGLRESTTFLGDGFGYLRRLPDVRGQSDIPFVFRHEPLAGTILLYFFRAADVLGFASPAGFAYAAASVLCGISCIVVLSLLVKVISRESDRIWMSFIVLATAGSQLFFGYVENYPPSYMGYLLFILTGILFLRGTISLVIPSVVFAFLFALYFGMLAFTPVLLLLYGIAAARGQWKSVVASAFACAGTAIVLLALSGYTFDLFVSRFGGAGSHFVPVFRPDGVWQGYTMFSARHALEVANVMALLSPFSLVLLPILLSTTRLQTLRKDPELLFIAANAVCGLLVIAVFQCDIGMSRDWDLLAVFALGTIVCVGVLIGRNVDDAQLRGKIYLVIAWVTLLHALGFVLVNSDKDWAIPRFRTLAANALWGTKAFSVYEELAIYYREEGDLAASLTNYGKFLSYDSTNGRILANAADVARRMGNENLEQLYTERAIHAGENRPDLWFTLGAIYGKAERYDEAIAAMERGLSGDSSRLDIVNAIGFFVMNGKKEYASALPHFLHVIARDSTFSSAYLNAGVCYYHLEKRERARFYLSRFLELQPAYPEADRLKSMME